ncbi:unnamed protein product [Urochloa humidicola]
MADEHFFPGDSSFPSGLGAAPFYYASASYAPPGLDAAAAAGMMQGIGIMAWADLHQQQLPDSSAAAAAHFDSALSSLVSSPAHFDAAGAGGDDDDDAAAIGDLIGRLGSICNGAGVTAASASNSCYSTPLSSPPRGGGAAASPAAALAFRSGYYPGAAAAAAAVALETAAGNGRLSRVASSMSLGAAAATTPGTGSPDAAPAEAETGAKVGGAAGEMRDPAPPAKGGGAARKRKASGKGKAASSAMTAAGNASPKRTKVAEGAGAGEGKDDGEEAAAAPETEPAKDYIHVRARRGQATDSHSLAERVRRERINERMKMLQSLVPGCNKITGKALMLDEIINYVQSLQRQVEFLSMKLATMNNPAAELDAADARYQTAAATLSSYGTAAADLPPFVAGAHPAAHHQLPDAGGSGCWEAQDLQSVIVAAAHDHDFLQYASPPAHGGGFHGKY